MNERNLGRHGLFQAAINREGEPLSWTRAQQVSLLLELWTLITTQINQSKEAWILAFRSADRDPLDDKSSLLNQDMGVRAAHAVANDILYRASTEWGLDSWSVDAFNETDTTQDDVDAAWDSLRKQRFYEHLLAFSTALVRFDWRSLDGPGIREDRQLMLTRRAYRGSGGYTLLTKDIFEVIADADHVEVSAVARSLLEDSK